MEATPSVRSLADDFAECIAEVKLVYKTAFHRDLAERVIGYHDASKITVRPTELLR